MAQTVLAGRTPTQIALRLDELLHKRWVARWAREDEASLAWLTYYTPMLDNDRAIVDACWAAMVAEPSVVDQLLSVAPRARFSGRMNGQELTCWMLADFEHLLWSSEEPDHGLVQFNRDRRARILLPSGWPTGG
jgi:hypothetical protein